MKKIQTFAKSMSDLLYIMRAESDLSEIHLCTPNTDTNVPDNFIEKTIDDKGHSTAMKLIIEKNIINHLTQCPDDFKNNKGEYEYQPDVYDFAYVVDSYIERLYEDTHITKTVWICPNCKSDNVQFKIWTDANTMTVTNNEHPMEDGNCYCKDCESTSILTTTELRPSSKVIGFQVIGVEGTQEEGEIHPEMKASFRVYNLSQANKMILDDNNGKENWKLLTCWSGNVKEPTIMFKGNPRN